MSAHSAATAHRATRLIGLYGLTGAFLCLVAATPAAARQVERDAPPSSAIQGPLAAGMGADLTPRAATSPAVDPAPGPPSSFWTPHRVLVISGISASVAAASVALVRELQLRTDRRELTSLPPGSVDQFNTQFAAATLVMKSRDFWRGVAIGVGGVTIGYVLTSASDDVGPTNGLHRQPPHGWTIRLNPFGPGVSVVGSF